MDVPGGSEAGRPRAWARLIEPAGDAGLTIDARERWALTNAVLILGATFSALGAVVFLALSGRWMAMAATAVGGAFIAGYVLSRAGHRRVAGALAIAALDASLLYTTSRYGAGVVDAVYLLSVSLAFAVFDRDDLAWLVAALAATLAAAVVGASPLLPRATAAVGPATVGVLRIATIALVIASVSTVLFYFLASRHRASRRLQSALIAAEAASQAKSSFLTNISHEVRTPMNGVLGMMSILEDTPLDEAQRDCVRTARASAMSLLDVLNDVLDLSRVEAGALVLEESPFDLRTVIEESAQQAAAYARHKEIEVVVDVAPHIPTQVIGDAGRIRQILVNLLNNAVKFTVRGQVVVTVSFEAGAGSRTNYRIAVDDTGIGIPDTELAAIFDKFRQVDGSTSRTHGGVGLGLAIVRELVGRMGGEVDVDSTMGQGSTFWFRLPISIDPEPQLTSTELLPTAELSGLRVLVVDDLARARDAVVAHLESWGAKVVACADGVSGLSALRDGHERAAPFDLALIDRRMGGMDGMELGDTIRDASALIQPVLVLMTGLNDPVTEAELQGAGFAGSVRKPIVASELARIVIDTWRVVMPADSPSGRGRRPSTDIDGLLELDAVRGARVLVVEDNPINQKVAVRLLENLGCHADVAANGREALAMVADVAYEFILMDVQMPEMDGLEATAAIRRGQGARRRGAAGHLGRDAGPPAGVPVIIAMTAHAMEEDRRRCMEAGMDDYLRKPIKQRELARVLRRYAERQAG